jgi:hypothetical protein
MPPRRPVKLPEVQKNADDDDDSWEETGANAQHEEHIRPTTPTNTNTNEATSDESQTSVPVESDKLKQIETRKRRTVGFIFCVVVWQMFARTRDMPTPAELLFRVVKFACTFLQDTAYNFLRYGMYVVDNYINLRSVSLAIGELCMPIVYFLSMPMYFAKGVYQYMSEDSDNFNVNVIVLVAAVAVILVLLERYSGEKYKFSVLLTAVGSRCKAVYERFGLALFDAASFYTVIKLDRFIESLFAVLKPLGDVFAIPLNAARGFFNEFTRDYMTIDKQTSVILGVFTIAFLAAAYFTDVLQFFRSLNLL